MDEDGATMPVLSLSDHLCDPDQPPPNGLATGKSQPPTKPVFSLSSCVTAFTVMGSKFLSTVHRRRARGLTGERNSSVRKFCLATVEDIRAGSCKSSPEVEHCTSDFASILNDGGCASVIDNLAAEREAMGDGNEAANTTSGNAGKDDVAEQDAAPRDAQVSRVIRLVPGGCTRNTVVLFVLVFVAVGGVCVHCSHSLRTF